MQFTNRFTRNLPGDTRNDNTSRQVYQAAFSSVTPTPVSSPSLLAITEELAKDLGFGELLDDREQLARILSGNILMPGMQPFAMAYGGHQFGHWAGQLGDGRAINLGEVQDNSGKHWSLQLKGAGVTPFSRHADGRAVLRSSLREYLCSEAMYHLGVPTTRALSLVLTGESVVRDMFYDGHPEPEPGAIVCRVAPSFVRFGNFELPASRGDKDLLRRLLDFVIQSDSPELAEKLTKDASATEVKKIYLDWFAQVCDATRDMIVHWMRLGFVHGVMNTDNMSILGLTIDYGPYGWLDDYDPDWTPNTTDAQHRRYRFGQQPAVSRWNLYQLANAIYPLIEDADALQAILDALPVQYEQALHKMMCSKLGIDESVPGAVELVAELQTLLRSQPTDMTLFFRNLANFDARDEHCHIHDCVYDAFYNREGLLPISRSLYLSWEASYRRCLGDGFDQQSRINRMNSVNPRYVPRNYLAQEAIDALEKGDGDTFYALLDVMKKPYEDQPEHVERFGKKRPDWATDRPGCSTLSCSS